MHSSNTFITHLGI